MRRTALRISLFVIVLVAVVLAATAQEPKRQFVSFGAPALRPEHSICAYGVDAYGRLTVHSQGANTFSAPLHLPQGAVIARFSAWLTDNSAAADATVYLCCRPLKEGPNAMTVLSELKTPGMQGDLALFNKTSITVDNRKTAYYVAVALPDPGTSLSGIRIAYKPS